MKDVNIYKNNKSYDYLSKSLLILKYQISVVKKPKETIDLQSKSDLQCNKAERLIEDIVTDIAKDIKELFIFAYELLKIDVN